MPTPPRPPSPGRVPAGLPDLSQLADLQKKLAEMKRHGLVPADFVLPDLTELARLATEQPTVPGRDRQSRVQPYTPPESRRVVILSAAADQTITFVKTLTALFTARGYHVDPDHELSLARLRALGNPPPGTPKIAVLILNTHSESTEPKSPTRNIANRFSLFAKASADDLVEPGASLTARDVVAHRVEAGATYRLLTHAPADTPGETIIKAEGDLVEGYSAKLSFFQHYWADAVQTTSPLGSPVTEYRFKPLFAKHSIVYLASCNASDPYILGLLKGCGAGTVLSWSNNVAFVVAEHTGLFIFDRLLGTGCAAPACHPEPVRQRPLVWSEIMPNLRLHHTSTGLPLGGPYERPLGGMTELRVLSDNGAGACLLPSLQTLHVDEAKEELTLQGWLGDDPGAQAKILLSDTPDFTGRVVELEQVPGSWDDDGFTVTCRLPAKGDLTEGYVRLERDGRPSNTLPLTVWRGELLYEAQGPQSMQEEGRLQFHLRTGLVRPRRHFDQPCQPAAYEPFLAEPAHASQASTFSAIASGSAQYAPPKGTLVREEVSGRVEAPPASQHPDPTRQAGQRAFEVVLGVQAQLQPDWTEKIDTVWQVLLPYRLMTSPAGLHTWTLTRESGPPEQQKISPLSHLDHFLTRLDQKGLTDYAFPLEEHALPQAPGKPWERVTFRFHSTVHYPAAAARGEDYSPAVTVD